jgi:hypothetical protein
MCHYQVIRWYGRMGNNLLQILNAIIYGMDKNAYSIEIISHPIFYISNNIINENGCNCDKLCNMDDITGGIVQKKKYNLSFFKKIFKKHISYKYNNSINIIYDIGIHIRSGDIFSWCPHDKYPQPPLDYYVKIIDKNIKKNIIIVYENTLNPVINILIKKYKEYKNINFQSSSVTNDINILSRCKTLVISNGTFNVVAFVLSNTITKIIVPSYMDKNDWFSLNDDIIEIINIPNYIQIGEWKNSIEQRKLMLEYKM